MGVGRGSVFKGHCMQFTHKHAADTRNADTSSIGRPSERIPGTGNAQINARGERQCIGRRLSAFRMGSENRMRDRLFPRPYVWLASQTVIRQKVNNIHHLGARMAEMRDMKIHIQRTQSAG